MNCYKIISLKRKKDSTEYLKYYLFPNKLVGISNKSNKIKEYQLADRAKVEEQFSKVLNTKIRIGFSIVNDDIDPVFYNQFNAAIKGFDALMKNENGIRYRFSLLKDSEGDNYEKPHSELDKTFLIEKYQNNTQLIHLYATFSSLSFRIDLNRHSMQYVYRFAINLWDNVRWLDTEPYDKFDCELGKSIIAFAMENEPKPASNFWTKIKSRFKRPAPLTDRFAFLSKGIISFVDLTTQKVYSVEEYEPKYDKPARPNDIIIHENPIVFMAYVWERLEEDIAYSMEYK